MNDPREELSNLSQRADALAAEKHRREEMLVVRKTFKEPMVERDRLPRWLTLLQEKKSAQQQTEHDSLSKSRWSACLQRQQWAINRHSQSQSSSSASHTIRDDSTSRSKLKVQAGSQQYMSSWLRQLNSEVEREEGETTHL
jgi:hypothetical protein